MKKFVYLLLLSTMMLTGCSLEKKQYQIEMIIKSTEGEFWKTLQEGARAAAEIYGMQLDVYGPEFEDKYKEQLQYMEEAIARKPDAIILAAGEYTWLDEQVQKATTYGIPIVTVDSDIDNKETVAYIGTDNEAIGRALGEELVKNIEKSGEIGIINFAGKSKPAISREKGFRDIVEGVERFDILEAQYCFSNVREAEKLTTELLEDHPNLVAIAGLNKDSAEGAAEAVRKMKDCKVKVYAIDCSPREAAYMEQGIIAFALVQNPYQMGYYAVETAYKYLQGERVESIYTDIYPVDTEVLFDEMYEQLIFPFEE